MSNLNELSGEQLVALAFQHGLIGGYSISDDRYVVVLDTGELELEPDVAPFFLRGMIRTYQHAVALQRARKMTA